MVLCDTEIRAAISNSQIIIDPPPPADHITTTAVDLTLGAEFRRWVTPEGGIDFAIDPSHPSFNYHKVASKYQESVQLEADGSVILKPHDFILGLTKERVILPETSRLAARVEGRSRLARLGLAIHLTAPTIHAGFRGHITLEITNQGPIPIKLRPGLPICQLIFEVNGGVANAPRADFEVVAFTTTTTKGEQIPFGNPRLRGLRAPSGTPNKEAHSSTARGCGSLRRRMVFGTPSAQMEGIFQDQISVTGKA